MKKVSISNVESHLVGEDSASCRLSEALGATNIALNHYRLAPARVFLEGFTLIWFKKRYLSSS